MSWYVGRLAPPRGAGRPGVSLWSARGGVVWRGRLILLCVSVRRQVEMFKDLLRSKKKGILERWFAVMTGGYAEGASEFLRKDHDPFSNPVGFTIRRDIEVLFDELVAPGDSDRRAAALDSIMRINAVQEFSPSQATGFVVLLKQVIREVLHDEMRAPGGLPEWMEFEPKIDALMLEAFDMYVRLREQIYDLRVKEIARDRERVLRVLDALAGRETGSFLEGDKAKSES